MQSKADQELELVENERIVKGNCRYGQYAISKVESYVVKLLTFWVKRDVNPDGKAAVVTKVCQVVMPPSFTPVIPTQQRHCWKYEAKERVKDVVGPATHDVGKGPEDSYSEVERHSVHQFHAWQSLRVVLNRGELRS